MVELGRRNADIEKDPIDLAHTSGRQQAWHLGVLTLEDLDSISERFQSGFSRLSRSRVAIDPDRARSDECQHRCQVPATTGGSIAENLTISRC
jgi:hypothetical protein